MFSENHIFKILNSFLGEIDNPLILSLCLLICILNYILCVSDHSDITFLDEILKDKQPPIRLLGSHTHTHIIFHKKTYHFDNDFV